MDDNEGTGCAIWIFVVIMCLVLGFSLGQQSNSNTFKQEAIKLGYAEYNRTTGEWQWIKKAEQEANDE